MSKVLNESNFQQTVQSKGVVLVDFWAPWCGPCKMLSPVIEKLAQDYKSKAVIAKVDVDDNAALAEEFGIMTIPTIYVFKDGSIVEKVSGYKTQEQLSAMIDKHLS